MKWTQVVAVVANMADDDVFTESSRVSVDSAGASQDNRLHTDLPADGHRALRRCKSTGSGGRGDSVTRSRSFGRRYVSVKVKKRQG